MFDKEIEAIAKCTELIKDLDDIAKMRVIKYLIERFGIGSNPINTNTYNPNHQLTEQIQNDEFAQPTYVSIVDVQEEYPTLKQLLIKNLPKNEPEWILCYAFLASKFGEDTFKKEDILEKYKDNNRLSPSNSANLSNNINACIKKDWIKDTNKGEFILKPEGVTYAKEVLKGNSISKEVKKTKRSKPNNEKAE